VIGTPVFARRLVDPDADAGESIAVEMGLDGTEPVVAGQPTARFDLKAPDGEVHLVVNDHQPGQVFDAETAYEGKDRQSRLVHVGLREGQGQSFPVHPGLGHERAFPPGQLEPLTSTTGQQGDDVGAGIVPGPGELRPGIAEADGQQVGGSTAPRSEQALASLARGGR
jgi:hypothetical protein